MESCCIAPLEFVPGRQEQGQRRGNSSGTPSPTTVSGAGCYFSASVALVHAVVLGEYSPFMRNVSVKRAKIGPALRALNCYAAGDSLEPIAARWPAAQLLRPRPHLLARRWACRCDQARRRNFASPPLGLQLSARAPGRSNRLLPDAAPEVAFNRRPRSRARRPSVKPAQRIGTPAILPLLPRPRSPEPTGNTYWCPCRPRS